MINYFYFMLMILFYYWYIYRRFAFLFEKSILLCKARGDNYDAKEIFDLQKFKIADVPPVGKGKVSCKIDFFKFTLNEVYI